MSDACTGGRAERSVFPTSDHQSGGIACVVTVLWWACGRIA